MKVTQNLVFITEKENAITSITETQTIAKDTSQKKESCRSRKIFY